MKLEECAERSMALCAFPCPPLPIMVLRENSGDYDTVSSHDLISVGMTRNRFLSDAAKIERMHTQMSLLKAYNASLDQIFKDSPDNIEKAYETMQKYTRETLALYTGNKYVDARFAPLDSVCKGDNVHKRAAEHLVLHRLLSDSTKLEVDNILQIYYKEIVATFFKLYCLDAIELSKPR